MFNWFWNFLYSISKAIFQVIDGLMKVANMICGIDPIKINDEETDLISYLFKSDNIQFAFKATAVIGIILVVILAIIAIIRVSVKEKVEDTPGGICIKAFKAILTFMFVPFIMIVVINLLNVFMVALYKATLANSASIGDYLFTCFVQDSDIENAKNLVNEHPGGWTSTSLVRDYIDLNEYGFFMSWLAGAAILINIAWALLLFVDRAISLVILFIVSPLSISSTVIDGGARFKLWRDQVLTKFAVGYGAIIGINIYLLVVNAVMGVTFFDNTFLNNLVILLFIIGGALSMKKSMSLVGNLVSQGAGSQELREAAMNRGGLMRALGSGIKGTFNTGVGAIKAGLHPVQTGRNVGNAFARGLGYNGFKGEPSAQERQLQAQERTNELLENLTGNKFNGGGANNNDSLQQRIMNSGNNSGDGANNALGLNNNEKNQRQADMIRNSGMNLPQEKEGGNK